MTSPSYIPPVHGPGPYFFQSPPSYLPPQTPVPPQPPLPPPTSAGYLPPSGLSPTSTQKPRRGYTKFFNFDLGTKDLALRKDSPSTGLFPVKQFVNLGTDDNENEAKSRKFDVFVNPLQTSQENRVNIDSHETSLMISGLKAPGPRKTKKPSGHDKTVSDALLEYSQPRGTIYREDISPDEVEEMKPINKINEGVAALPLFDVDITFGTDDQNINVEDFETFEKLLAKVDQPSARLGIQYESHPEAKLGELKYEPHPEEKLGEGSE